MSRLKLTYISLFSGCGGFDEGFQRQGFECLGAYDIDPIVIDVHKKNIGGPAFVHDLLDPNLPGEKDLKNVDVVISGSPCQGFSTVGKRRVGDPRNKLLVVGGEIAIKLKAKVFIAENVMGSASGEHKIYWQKLEDLLKKNKYNIKMLQLEATKLGLPQLRKRVIMLAWKGKQIGEINIPTYPTRSLREFLGDKGLSNLPNNEYFEIDEVTKTIAGHIRPGQKLSNVRGGARSVHTWDIASVFGKTTKNEKEILLTLMSLRRKIRKRRTGDADPVDISILADQFKFDIKAPLNSLVKKGFVRQIDKKTVDLANTFNGKYRRLAWDMPSPTVDTRFGDPKYFLHPEENRGLTAREAARIQGFRDNFLLLGTKEQQFRMIGNAVPPPMSNEIAKIVKEKIAISWVA